MPDRVTYARENPGIKNASWNRQRQGAQDIQEIAGARTWVAPRMQRDDSREGTGLEPLPVVERTNVADAPVYEPYIGEAQTQIPKTTTFENVETGHKFTVPQPEWSACDLCRRRASECSILVALHHGHICDQCTEQAIDAVRQEIPKRRLRLALERMMQGEVTEAMVAEVERLTGGKNG